MPNLNWLLSPPTTQRTVPDMHRDSLSEQVLLGGDAFARGRGTEWYCQGAGLARVLGLLRL